MRRGPIQPLIPAILNALHDAIGVCFTEMPVTPEKVLVALVGEKRNSLSDRH